MKRVKTGFIITIIVIILISVSAFFYIQRLIDSGNWVDHTNETLRLIDRKKTLLYEAESSFRGYLLSNDPEYLDRYNQTGLEVVRAMSRLRKLTSSNINQQLRLDTIRELVQQKYGAMNALIEKNRNGITPGRKPEFDAQGKEIMQQIVGVASRMSAEEARLLTTRLDNFQNNSIYALIFFVAAFGTTLLALSVMFFRSLKEVQRSFALKAEYEKQSLELVKTKEIDQIKDVFMSMASHELKTPLTSAHAYVQLLEKISDDPTHLNYVGKVKTQIGRINSMIADMLDVAKLQTGKLQYDLKPISLQELVEECVHTVQHISPGYTITVTGSLENAIVEADKIRLEQVVENMLSNAIKYSPKAKDIAVMLSRSGAEAIVAVRDRGIGIPKEKQSRVFDRFYRVHEHAALFKGLGIGLYICNEIIKRHNGRMWVESEVGEGSTFFFALPVS